jgi:hypothetical protein
MKVTITLKKDEESGEVYIDMDDLVDCFDDISIIDGYEIEEMEDNSIAIRFYDVKGNVVNPRKIS